MIIESWCWHGLDVIYVVELEIKWFIMVVMALIVMDILTIIELECNKVVDIIMMLDL